MALTKGWPSANTQSFSTSGELTTEGRMEVIPNIGIGPVRFGMSPAEALAAIPEGQKYEEWMGGNRNDSLLFHGLILGFD